MTLIYVRRRSDKCMQLSGMLRMARDQNTIAVRYEAKGSVTKRYLCLSPLALVACVSSSKASLCRLRCRGASAAWRLSLV